MTFSIEKLTRSLRPVSDEQDANASVAVLLKLEHGRLCVLFVRRVKNSRDPWSGQIALPGGKREAKDGDLKETVIRETLEETSINLLHHCRFLGVMSAFRSRPRPEIKVLPFVILTEDEPLIKLNEKELEQCFWISVEELSGNRKTVASAFGESPAFVLNNVSIWGLTHTIIESLMYSIETGTQPRSVDE